MNRVTFGEMNQQSSLHGNTAGLATIAVLHCLVPSSETIMMKVQI